MNPTDAVNVLKFLERQVAQEFGSPESKASLQRVADHLKLQVQRLTSTAYNEPAFPIRGGLNEHQFAGASVRDLFAMVAMHAHLITDTVPGPASDALLQAAERAGQDPVGRIAFNAYEVADWMLKERTK
ncbi:MAG TPA: hypothetical protein PK861_08360 [Thermomonas sp.]|nr:hypothetical protein [Thermomonas sp.]